MRQASDTKQITVTLTENEWAWIAKLIDGATRRMALDRMMGGGDPAEVLMLEVALSSLRAQLAAAAGGEGER